MSEDIQEKDTKAVNLDLPARAHQKLKILCAAWRMTQVEVLVELLDKCDVSAAVERLR